MLLEFSRLILVLFVLFQVTTEMYSMPNGAQEQVEEEEGSGGESQEEWQSDGEEDEEDDGSGEEKEETGERRRCAILGRRFVSFK